MSATSVTLDIDLFVNSIVTLPLEYTGHRKIVLPNIGSQFTLYERLKPTSTPKPDEILSQVFTIGASDYELDLSSAPIVGATDGSGNPTAGEDLDGYKGLVFLFSTYRTDLDANGDPNVNSGTITVKPKTTTGYELFGSGKSTGIPLPPKTEYILVVRTANLPAIDNAGRRIILFSGTQNDKLNVFIAVQ